MCGKTENALQTAQYTVTANGRGDRTGKIYSDF